MLLLREFSDLHALLEEGEVFSEIYNRQCISHIFPCIPYCKVKPLIISLRICVVLQKQHVIIRLNQALICQSQVAALESRLKYELFIGFSHLPSLD